MGLVESVGNMYPFVTHTWNPIRGECKMGCSYCYVQHSRAKRYYRGEPHLVEKALKTSLGVDHYIFVGSMTDMWGNWISDSWIRMILQHCRRYPENHYLFQSKNPMRFLEFKRQFPTFCTLGTTIEALPPLENNHYERPIAMINIKQALHYPRMISVEPIMRFELEKMIYFFEKIKPSFVVIGADSKGHNLDEPPAENIRNLIKRLKKFTKVIQKDNLKRLLQ